MKRLKITLLVTVMTILSANMANAQGLGNLLGGNLGQTVGNLLEGVFSSSNITIADMQGEWTSDGPAVCFQGEGFLKKAGGAAAAATIESKLQSYYTKYGLTGAVLTVDEAGNFTLNCKSIKLKGTITQKADATPGVFEFDFNILGKKVAGVTTYVQKTSQTMDVMFDVTKLKKLISAVASAVKIDALTTITSLLDQYEGLCVGFHMTGTGNSGYKTGNVLGWGKSNIGTSTGTGTNETNTKESTDSKTTQSSNSNLENAVKGGLDLLKEKLKKK